MILERLLRPGPAKAAGARLYAALVAQARSPALYDRLLAPDTPDGRFEVYTLHVLLLLQRLRGQGRRAAAVSQAVFDAYVGGLDHGLRELAVGDLTVPKTMRRLGEAFYGRKKTLETALQALPDCSLLEALISRTVLNGAESPPAAPLAAYVAAARDDLAALPLERLLGGDLVWGKAVLALA
jgi:cytochrome b pre-mRNA-processing protein 3